MADTNIKVSLELADKAAQKALSDFISKSDNADKSLKKLGDSGKGTFNEIALSIGKSSGIFDIFAGNLAANVATKALEGLGAAAGLMFQTFVVDGVKAASEQQKANNDLNVALAQTGIYSSQAAEEFQKLAAEIQSTTGISDDAILTNAALIQSLGQLDKDGLKRATLAAVDLSAALGKDLSTTSEALARAANGNTTAIQKMGISFQKGRDDAETFENILSSLENRFSGTAAAKVNTFAGAVDLTKASFGELQEEVGNVIVQNSVVIEVLKTAGKIMQDFTTDVNGNSSAFKRMVGEGILVTIDALMLLTAASDLTMRSISVAANGIMVAYNGVGAAIANTLNLVGLESDEVADGFSKAFLESVDKVNNGFSKDSALGKIGETLAQLKVSAEQGFAALEQGASTSVAPINSIRDATAELTEEQKKTNAELQNWALNLAKVTTDGQAAFELQLEALRLHKEEELLINGEYSLLNAEAELMYLEDKKAAEQAYYLEQQARLDEAVNKGLLTTQQEANARKAIKDKAQTAEKKADIDLTKFKQEQEKLRGENMKSSLGYISSLQMSSQREFFEVGKAAALAVAYIDAQAAVTKALASAPAPFNFALAAAVGAAAAVNIARIASASPPAFEDGGIVPGNSFSGDKVAARVNSGEMVLNRSQQKELFAIANGKSSQSGDSISRSEFFSAIEAVMNRPAQINIDGKEIMNVIRNQSVSGRSFA